MDEQAVLGLALLQLEPQLFTFAVRGDDAGAGQRCDVAVQYFVVDLAVARAAALLFRHDAFDGLPDDAAVEQSALGFGFRELWHGVPCSRGVVFAALAWSALRGFFALTALTDGI